MKVRIALLVADRTAADLVGARHANARQTDKEIGGVVGIDCQKTSTEATIEENDRTNDAADGGVERIEIDAGCVVGSRKPLNNVDLSVIDTIVREGCGHSSNRWDSDELDGTGASRYPKNQINPARDPRYWETTS